MAHQYVHVEFDAPLVEPGNGREKVIVSHRGVSSPTVAEEFRS